MSHLLDEILAQASNGSPAVVALSSESVAILFFASKFIEERQNWLDRGVDPLDEVTDAEWNDIEHLVANTYEEIMHPVVTAGMINLWLSDDIPDGWLICNGQAISRAIYSALFDLWGITFGAGDGSTTFNLPDMRSIHPKGAGGVIALGAISGSSVVHLTVEQLPAHNHGVNDPGHTHQQHIGNNQQMKAFVAGGSGTFTPAGAATSSSADMLTGSRTTGITTQDVGLGDAISTAQPSIGVHYIVYAGF